MACRPMSALFLSERQQNSFAEALSCAAVDDRDFDRLIGIALDRKHPQQRNIGGFLTLTVDGDNAARFGADVKLNFIFVEFIVGKTVGFGSCQFI